VILSISRNDSTFTAKIPVTGEDDVESVEPDLPGEEELAAGGNLRARPERLDEADERERRVRLERIEDLERREGRSNSVVPLADHVAVVDEERRPDFGGDPGHRETADLEHPVGLAEVPEQGYLLL
jgi:hypothetical protein